MTIRPKTFVAAVSFSCAGQRFAAGDEVPPSAALSAALRFGDQFVTVKRTKKTAADTVVEVPTTTTGDIDADTKENT